MAPRLPQTTPRKMIQALKHLGFVTVRVRGSHHILRKGSRETCIAYHNTELSRALLIKILKQAGISIEEVRPHL